MGRICISDRYFIKSSKQNVHKQCLNSVQLLINRHNNKYSYTGASDDNLLKNIELFDKLSLRFSNRVLFIKDVIGVFFRVQHEHIIKNIYELDIEHPYKSDPYLIFFLFSGSELKLKNFESVFTLKEFLSVDIFDLLFFINKNL